MRTGILTIVLFFSSFNILAQSPQQYVRAKVDLNGLTIRDLANLGIEVDHGHWISKNELISDFSNSELLLIQDAGFSTEIIIDDVSRYYAEQNSLGSFEKGAGPGCVEDGIDYPTPQNFELGSMGGYFTYQEMLDELDAMVAAYPNLITAKQPILGGLTIEGRPLHWVRLSDNPATDEGEPEVLYTALHHAREPAGLSQMIYYLWYMLENYGSDEFVTYLIDNTELYFIPCVNPDGYLYNEINNPSGGGLWRKNRRINADSTYGVDLNRNYGNNWGLDNSGSSPFPGSNVYRGVAPFSEPETQLVRDFVEDRDFLFVLNYHTYGNYLIYPWAYGMELTPDSTAFIEYSGILTKENNYYTGTAFETVGYFVNGDSDDWMYDEHNAFAMTPEAGPGSYGFWPPLVEIDNICKASMWQNLSMAALVHNFGVATDLSPSIIEDISGSLEFSVKRYGMAPGQLTASIIPVSPNVVSVSALQSFSLDQFETTSSVFIYALDPVILQGEEVVFKLVIDNGFYTIEKELVKVYGTLADLLSDDIQDLDNWNNGQGPSSWALTTDEFYSAPSSITDSPEGEYPPNILKIIELSDPLELIDAINANLQFWTKWDIEAGWDYVQVQASNDGTLFTPLCGKYTKPGATPQDPGQPVYDGKQPDWVLEEMNLMDFLGDQLYIRFILVSDGGVEEDGFYFDDVSVEIITELSTSISELGESRFTHRILPNPSSGNFVIEILDNPILEPGIFRLYNSNGQIVFSSEINSNQALIEIEAAYLPSGFYPYSIIMESGNTIRGKALIFTRSE